MTGFHKNIDINKTDKKYAVKTLGLRHEKPFNNDHLP